MIEGWAAPEAIVAHARRFYDAGGVPSTPRVAATVVLLRPAPGLPAPAGPGFEAYVIRRVAGMAFGGVYAFPGGGVDASDASVHVDWAGPDADAWSRRLGVPPREAQAVVCAAAREVFEEAGVLLAGPRDRPRSVVGDVSGDEWEGARRALVARELGFAELLAGRGLALRSDLLAPWSRWVTPEFEPRRFDTYFFVAALPAGQRTRDVSGEADLTEWVAPGQALGRAEAGEIAMLPPTMAALQSVGECADIDAVFAASAGRDAATPVTPRLDFDPDGTARFRLG
jgi:8-oxo-dGTP pyrophosphatase MutT (NUDIX family)